MEELFFVIGGFLGGIFVDGEYKKFLEIIGGKGILEVFVKISMEDYLFIFKEFEVKKCEVFDKVVRIKIFLKFD